MKHKFITCLALALLLLAPSVLFASEAEEVEGEWEFHFEFTVTTDIDGAKDDADSDEAPADIPQLDAADQLLLERYLVLTDAIVANWQAEENSEALPHPDLSHGVSQMLQMLDWLEQDRQLGEFMGLINQTLQDAAQEGIIESTTSPWPVHHMLAFMQAAMQLDPTLQPPTREDLRVLVLITWAMQFENPERENPNPPIDPIVLLLQVLVETQNLEEVLDQARVWQRALPLNSGMTFTLEDESFDMLTFFFVDAMQHLRPIADQIQPAMQKLIDDRLTNHYYQGILARTGSWEDFVAWNVAHQPVSSRAFYNSFGRIALERYSLDPIQQSILRRYAGQFYYYETLLQRYDGDLIAIQKVLLESFMHHSNAFISMDFLLDTHLPLVHFLETHLLETHLLETLGAS